MRVHLRVCLVTQSCPTLWDPVDCGPPGSSAHGILQARTLEWVALPSSRGSSQRRDWTQASHTAGGFFAIWASREAQVRFGGFFISRLVESTVRSRGYRVTVDGEEPSTQGSNYMLCVNCWLQGESPSQVPTLLSEGQQSCYSESVSSWLSFCTSCLLILVSWPTYWHKVFSGISLFSF